jgi:ABC-type branched-subunit amino acid transport system substrate-binding protein
MRKSSFLKNIVMLACMSLFLGSLGACQSEPSELKIGQLLPFTGSLSFFGEDHGNSAKLAADQISAAGGPTVILSQQDSQVDPDVGVEAARKLVDVDNVAAIVGALSSGVSMAVANAVTAPNEILQISAASTSPGLTVLEDNDFVFRTTVSDAAQGVVLGRLALELGYKTAGAMYVNNPYGEGLVGQFKDSFEAGGGVVTGQAAHEDEQPSFASELAKATEGDPDVLISIGYPGQAQVYLREALEGGYIDNFLFTDGTKSADMFEALGWGDFEGMYGTAPGTVENDARSTFNADYSAAYGPISENPYMAETYDAVILIALAAEKAGTTTDSAKIRDALRDVATAPGEKVGPGVAGLTRAFELIADGKDINYEGAGGSQDFDSNGDVASTIEIWQVKGSEVASTGRYELP